MDNSLKNKRIALNTLYMYLRMFITMSVGLYTSRVVLNSLGVEDYGLYNVIGGIIAMFGFLNGAMTNTTSRFITFYLGKDEEEKLKEVFSMAFLIHFIIALIIVFLGETIGLWYLYEKLVIPEGRFAAALWLYQLSIAASVVNILYIPYNASIVAHEKMNAFAAIAIIDAVLKLVISLLIKSAPFDKLVFYGLMIFIVTFIDILCYVIYCNRHFIETKIRLIWNYTLLKDMFSFTGWSMFGNFAFLFYSYGINLILNLFCGPVVNAARGISLQVENVVRQFASNVQTALNPQIIKSYAEKDLNRMHSLIYASSRYCFYLLYLLALPILIETEYILYLWLGNVPDHTVNFVRITLLLVMLDALATPLFTANLATGKIKKYQSVLSLISYSLMPVTYFAMKYTLIPEVAFLCLAICKISEQIARVVLTSRQILMPLSIYFQKVIFPNVSVFFLSMIVPLLLDCYIESSFFNLLLVALVSVASVIVTVFSVGMSNYERNIVVHKAVSIKNRILYL